MELFAFSRRSSVSVRSDEDLKVNAKVIDSEANSVTHRKTERCVLCGCDTGISFYTDVMRRQWYVEGVGQLCKSCFVDVPF